MKRLLIVLMVVAALLSSVSLAAAAGKGGKLIDPRGPGGMVKPNGFAEEWIEI